MKEQEIKDYRKVLEAEYTAKDSEIETTLSYITIGALGFFITINDKFLRIQDSKHIFLLIVSLILMFGAFVLILIRKSKTIRNVFDLMTQIDRIEANNEAQDKELYEIWENGHKTLTKLRKSTFICLSLGIGLQILFLLLNI
jgi:hypothetical protein